MPKIDPWSSEVISDYEHLYTEFGLQKFPEEWKKELKHYFFERNIIIAHRDFEKIMSCIKQKKPFINITGIATSGKLHLGHKIDIEFFLFLKSLGARNYFIAADIDAFVSRPDSKIPTLEKAKEIAVDNIAHLLAFGLTEKDIKLQSRMPTRYYEFAFELSKKITRNTFEAVYGHIDLGKISAAILQYADILHPQLKEFEGRMPSITCIGLDQEPHARITRDIAKRLPYNLEVPSFIYFKHQSGLKENSKMSSSDEMSAIFLDDDAETIEKKILNAFTGGRNTAEEQKRLGANIEVCKVCEILRFHFPDTKKLFEILENERKGKTLCGETKKFTIEFLTKMLEEHQKKAEKMKTKAEKIVFG